MNGPRGAYMGTFTTAILRLGQYRCILSLKRMLTSLTSLMLMWGGDEVKVILTTAALIFSAAVVFCCTLTSRPWVLSSWFRVESALHCRFMARSYQKLTKLLTHPDITRKLSKLRQIFTVCVFFWFESLLKVNSSKMGHYPEALLDGDCA